MKASGWLAAGALGLMLQGCATREECCVIPAYPPQSADNNAHVLEVAVDNLVARTRNAGALYSSHQRIDHTVLQAQFDEVAMMRDFKSMLQQNVMPTSLPSSTANCVTHHVVQATFWDFQDRMRGKLQPVPRQNAVGGSIFSNTWNNVALYCGVQNPEMLKGDVNEGWRRAAAVVNAIQFGSYK